MKVESVLESKGRHVETTVPDSQVRLLLHRLTIGGIGSLVVSSDGRRFDGVVSDQDIVRALNKHGERFFELQVKDIMSLDSPTCTAQDSLQHVMDLMTRTRRRHVPVVDEAGNLGGLVSLGDVVKHLLGEMELERNVLRDAYRERR